MLKRWQWVVLCFMLVSSNIFMIFLDPHGKFVALDVFAAAVCFGIGIFGYFKFEFRE